GVVGAAHRAREAVGAEEGERGPVGGDRVEGQRRVGQRVVGVLLLLGLARLLLGGLRGGGGRAAGGEEDQERSEEGTKVAHGGLGGCASSIAQRGARASRGPPRNCRCSSPWERRRAGRVAQRCASPRAN